MLPRISVQRSRKEFFTMFRCLKNYRVWFVLLAAFLNDACVGDPGTTSSFPTGFTGKEDTTSGSGGTTTVATTHNEGGTVANGGTISSGGTVSSGGAVSSGGKIDIDAYTGGKATTGGSTRTAGTITSGGSPSIDRDSGIIDTHPVDAGSVDTRSQDTPGSSTCTPAANAAAAVHRAGSICINCHGPGGDSPSITVAGTVYSTAAGGPPVAGATIKIGNLTMVTDKGGTFYSTAKVNLDFPSVGKCPDIDKVMGTKATNADCNGCHKAGNRIHLP
jgi:hypothetical protein